MTRPAQFRIGDKKFLALALAAFSLLAAGWQSGCATAPVKVSTAEAAANPEALKNKPVEVTGLVLSYEPMKGDLYRTFRFILGQGPGEEVEVEASGYTVDALAKAAALVEQAFGSHEPITAVGVMKVSEAGGPELKLRSVEYRGQKIVVNRGPQPGPGFSIGGLYIRPSLGVEATITP